MLEISLAISAIEAQFPELAPVRVKYLGEGYDSSAFQVNDAWVFRFPKRADVEHQLLVEMQVLPVLSRTTPVPIPLFCFHGQPSPDFPRHFAGYPKIPGVPAISVGTERIPVSSVAPSLAQFLSWLHSFPITEAARYGVPEVSFDAVLEDVSADALEDFELVSRVAPTAPLDKWYAYLKAGLDSDARHATPSVLVHGDLAAEHILVDPTSQSVTGVIDWSDISIGDPAVDLAGLFHWGGDPFADAVLSGYGRKTDVGVLRRARFIAACRGVGDVPFGLGMNRQEYIVSGLRALELCIGG